MKRRSKLLKEIRELAEKRPNDAVKLAFLSREDMDLVDELDLQAVTEFKRGKDGGVEVKFVDRLGTLKWLLETTGGDPRAEKLYRALEGAGRQPGAEEE